MSEIEEIDKALQDLMDVVIEHGFDVTSPDCIALANDIRRLTTERNNLLSRKGRVKSIPELLERIEQSEKHGLADDWTPEGQGYNKGLKRAIELIYEFEDSMRESLRKLVKWTPEHVDLKAISRINYPRKCWPKKEYGEICTDEDCKAPFLTEAYLYNLLGKDDARTLLALVRRLCNSLDGEGWRWLR